MKTFIFFSTILFSLITFIFSSKGKLSFFELFLQTKFTIYVLFKHVIILFKSLFDE